MELNRASGTGKEANIDFNTNGVEKWQLGMQDRNPAIDDFEFWDGLDNPIWAVSALNNDFMIGTTTGYAELTVWGDAGTGTAFNVVTAASSTSFTILNNGNVGIGGTTTPTYPLTVLQATGVNTVAFQIDGTGAGAGGGAEMALNRDTTASSEANIDFNTLGTEFWQLGMQNNSTNDFELWDGNDNPAFTIKNSTNNVGISTTTPDDKLTIAGGGLTINPDVGADEFKLAGRLAVTIPVPYFTPTKNNQNIALDVFPKGSPGNGFGSSIYGVAWQDICSTDVAADGTNYECLHLGKSANGYANISTSQGGTGTVRDLSLQLFGGNVGIATDTPGSLLSVGNTGGINFSLGTSTFSSTGGINLTNGCFAIKGTCLSTSGSLTGTTGQTAYFSGTNTAVGTSTIFINTASSVGIGTVSPSTARMTIDNFNDSNSANIRIRSLTNRYRSDYYMTGASGGFMNFYDDTGSVYLPFQIDASNTILGMQGNVGIGTSTQNYILSAFSATAPQLALSAGAGLAQFTFRNAGGNFYISTTTVAGTATTTTSALTIIGATGNVGIATSSPFTKLSVIGNEYVTGDFSATGNGYVGGVFGINTSVASIIANTHTMDVTAVGNAQNVVSLIRNTNNANNFLQFQPTGGNTTTNVNWLMGVNGSSDNFSFGLYDGSSVKTKFSIVDITGNVGIGTTTPTSLLSLENASSTIATSSSIPFGSLISMLIDGARYMVESFDYYGHKYTQGPVPVLTSCGTSPTITGNDKDMVITVGSVSATGCTITFAHTYITAPRVNITNRSMSITNAMTYTVSATQIVVSQIGLTGDVLDISVGGIK